MKPMAASSTSPQNPPKGTPIKEGNEDDEFSQSRSSFSGSTPSNYYKHKIPTPEKNRGKNSSRNHPENNSILCNKCRPSNREKISIVPFETNNRFIKHSISSPNVICKSVLASLVLKKSPKSSDCSSFAADDYKNTAEELSNKLIHATRKRDEAILESSNLKHSMAELEKKLNKLEIYCQNLKTGLNNCSTNSKLSVNYDQCVRVGNHDRVIEHFLVSISESRISIRALARALTLQLRLMGVKVFERISILLQPYDIKVSFSRNPRGLILYVEALLNRAFYEDFESSGFQKNGASPILNPIDRCESNLAMFGQLHGLTWEEVLNKGTKHFSKDFSKFCDRKMSEIVAMLGWNRAWPEPLLHSFFGASKTVYLVHLLANSVHPSLPIFRVDKGVGFDSVYMEDMSGEKAKKLVPAMVRIMVAPGFYVYDNVVKCKVICRYYSNNGSGVIDSEYKGLTPSPL